MTNDKDLARSISGGKLSVSVREQRSDLVVGLRQETKLTGFFSEVSCGVDKADGTCGLGIATDNSNLIWLEITPSTQQFALLLLENGEWGED